MDIKEVSSTWEKEVERLWWKKQGERKRKRFDVKPWLHHLGLKPQVSGGLRRKLKADVSPVPT